MVKVGLEAQVNPLSPREEESPALDVIRILPESHLVIATEARHPCSAACFPDAAWIATALRASR